MENYSPFGGTVLKDVAFFHKSTKTLIVGDLVYNLPNTESMPSALNFLWKTFSPGGAAHGKLIAGSVQNRDAVVADAKKVDALDFETIIPLHGVRILLLSQSYCWPDCRMLSPKTQSWNGKLLIVDSYKLRLG